MRIVHLTSNHIPTDVRIFLKEARTLTQAGHQVALVVPTDESGQIDGVEIIPVQKAKNRLDRFVLGFWRIYRAALTARGEAYHFHDPDLIPLGLLLRLQGKITVYDVHEDVPRDILSKHWILPILRGIIAKAMAGLEWLAGRFLNGIVAATPAIARRWPPEKTVVLQNFPFQEELAGEGGLPYTQRPHQAVYLGGIEVIRGIREMVQAMEHLPSNGDAQLVLGGRFAPAELEQEVRQMLGWGKVEFVGWVSRERMAEILAKARLGLILFHPVPNHIEAQPNKLFEYMSAGIPVVASDFPLWREIVMGANCGLLVDPMDPKAIAQAIQHLLEHPAEAETMGQRGRQAVLEKYNWEAESKNLLEFYGRWA